MKNEEKNQVFRIRISILHKIMIHVGVLVFVAIGISTYLAVKEESRVLTAGLIHTAKHMAMHIASSTESAFGSLNWIFVEKTLRDISEHRHNEVIFAYENNEVIFAKVVKPDGEVYLADDKSYYGDKIDPSHLFDKETMLENFLFPENQEKGVLLVHPVTIGKERWYVLLGISLEPVRASIKALIIRNMVWGSGILFLAIIGSFFLSRSISGPLIKLAGSVKVISAGNLDQKVTVKSRDEIGLLGHSFNQMIVDLRSANTELETSEKRYRTLITTASKAGMGIVVIQNDGDRKGIFRYLNQGIADLSGYTREELINRSLTKMVHPDDQEKIWKLYSEQIPKDKLHTTYQFWGVRKNGEKFRAEISTGVTEFEGKKGLVCYLRDITEKLRAEEQLKNYSQNLEKMVEERTSELKKALVNLQSTQFQLIQSEKMASIGQLAAGVAHEINNPVGFVKSNLGTIDEYREDLMKLQEQYGLLEKTLLEGQEISENGDIRGVLEKIQGIKDEIDLNYILDDYQNVITESIEGMARVAKIVADLKNYAHTDKGEIEHADVNKGIESTLNIVWNELKYKAEVIKDLGDIPLVKCYPQRLNQVFTNILVNAAHAIDKKGEIRIATRADNGHVEIRVSDTGCGIPDDVISKIYDPFFTTKDVGKGTGLGLNVAYNIIEKHRGTIDVETEVGKGTTFIIRLQKEPDFEV